MMTMLVSAALDWDGGSNEMVVRALRVGLRGTLK